MTTNNYGRMYPGTNGAWSSDKAVQVPYGTTRERVTLVFTAGSENMVCFNTSSGYVMEVSNVILIDLTLQGLGLTTGKTQNVCGGGHDTYEDCARHFRAYCYGFMDGAIEVCGPAGYLMADGNHKLSFRFGLKAAGCYQVEYFMLLDKEGQDLMFKISNEGHAPAVED